MSKRTIDTKQMYELRDKINGNANRMLDFLLSIIGRPDEPKHYFSEEHLYECYGIFTHALEEYGKLLYVLSLTEKDGKYIIEYDKKFKDHKTKFSYAVDKLPDSIKDFYPESTWDARLNIFNTDIDDDGNATNISLNGDDMKMDKFRQCLSNFKDFLHEEHKRWRAAGLVSK